MNRREIVNSVLASLLQLTAARMQAARDEYARASWLRPLHKVRLRSRLAQREYVYTEVGELYAAFIGEGPRGPVTLKLFKGNP